MVRYIIRRLLAVVVLLFIVSIATFLIFFSVPKLAGTNIALLYCGRTCDAQALKGVEIKLGLDKPLVNQYGAFVKGIFVGRDFNNGPDKTHCGAPCLGYSFKSNQEVTSEILDRFPVTLQLTIGAALLWLVGGVSVGIISALKRGTVIDRAAMIGALAGVSMPIYFTSLVALYLFSYGPGWLRWFPNVTYVNILHDPVLGFRNTVLPWVCLAFLTAALYARLTRASMLETMSEDYVRTARAKGLPERTVIRRHGLRAALTPIVTIFGLDVGFLLGGAVITETVFGFPGIGKLAYDAISQQDLPVILGVTLLAATFIVLANLVVDVLYAVVDPRVRYS